jgi:hypothetical protein
MQIFSVGDEVSVIHDTIKGKVLKVEQHQLLIEDEFGFERYYRPSELTVVSSEKHYKNLNSLANKDGYHSSDKYSSASSPGATQLFEIDLHIENLLDTNTGMTNHEIVQYQLTACRAFVQQSIEKKRKKIVLIHGKGEGVLKGEIRQYLNGIEDSSPIRVDYHDANYQRYGIGGATEVVLFYNY